MSNSQLIKALYHMVRRRRTSANAQIDSFALSNQDSGAPFSPVRPLFDVDRCHRLSMLRGMTLKHQFIGLVITSVTFVTCCFLALKFHRELSAPGLMYPLLVVFGASALTFPLFAVVIARSAIGIIVRRVIRR